MPATPSSLVARIAQRLGHRDQPTPPEQGLVAQLASVPDPRNRRGVRHRLTSLLSVAVCAVLAGAKSLTAIGEWAADALHSQREHANFLVTGKGAAYLLIINRNQPHLYRQLKALPWGAVPVSDHTRGRGHGRDEIRACRSSPTGGLLFPHAVQAIRITRRTRALGSRR